MHALRGPSAEGPRENPPTSLISAFGPLAPSRLGCHHLILGHLYHSLTHISLLLRAADRYAYTDCGSTAYCYLFYPGDEQILIHIRKPCRSRTCLVRIAGSCPAGSLSSWPIPAVVYEPANHNRNAVCSQHLLGNIYSYESYPGYTLGSTSPPLPISLMISLRTDFISASSAIIS